jgi:uncharacterized delta-60 repeat protein
MGREEVRTRLSKRNRDRGASSLEALEPRQFLSASTLDTSFNSTGHASLKVGVQMSFEDVTVMSDGRVLAAGFVRFKNGAFLNTDFILARFTAAGKLDSTFGGGKGYVTTDLGGNEEATALLQLPSGKIGVIGNDFGKSIQSAFMVRYNSNGSLDTSFSGDGKTRLASNAFVSDMAVTNTGAVVVAGRSSEPGTKGDDLLLLKVKTDGALDTTFSGDGKAVVDLGSTSTTTVFNHATSLAIQTDGRIVVGSKYQYIDSASQPHADFCVARFNSTSGTLDTSFNGGKGYSLAHVSVHAQVQSIFSLALLPNGKILAGGLYRLTNIEDSGTGDFAILRFNSNGPIDTSFGVNGIARTNFGSNFIATALSVIPQANGKILAAGFLNPGAAIARYNSNGTPDTSFSGDGKMIATAKYLGHAGAASPGGKYVVAGYDGFGVVERYGADAVGNATISGSVYNDFNGDGSRQSREGGLSNWQVFIDANNDGFYTVGETIATTDSQGKYRLVGLAPGTYRVREIRLPGWTRTQPAGTYPLGYYDVTLGVSQNVLGKDFGNKAG